MSCKRCQKGKSWLFSRWLCVCVLTCGLANGQSQSDAGVAEGHDGSQDGQKPQAVKVWDLAEHNLEGSENEHEWVV